MASGEVNFTDAAKREELILAMEALLRSSGWGYLEASLRGAEQATLGAMDAIQNPNELMKALGELKQIRRQVMFPRMILEQALAARKKDQEKQNASQLADDPFARDTRKRKPR